jgi:hypothetical protein
VNTLRFDEPVYLTVGIGMPAEIDSVERAYALLNEWPFWRRNRLHQVALNACKAALAGDIDVETAKNTLAAFAERAEGAIYPSHAPQISYLPNSRTYSPAAGMLA